MQSQFRTGISSIHGVLTPLAIQTQPTQVSKSKQVTSGPIMVLHTSIGAGNAQNLLHYPLQNTNGNQQNTQISKQQADTTLKNNTRKLPQQPQPAAANIFSLKYPLLSDRAVRNSPEYRHPISPKDQTKHPGTPWSESSIVTSTWTILRNISAIVRNMDANTKPNSQNGVKSISQTTNRTRELR